MRLERALLALSVDKLRLLRTGDSLGVRVLAENFEWPEMYVVLVLRWIGRWTWDRVIAVLGHDFSVDEWAARMDCDVTVAFAVIRYVRYNRRSILATVRMEP